MRQLRALEGLTYGRRIVWLHRSHAEARLGERRRTAGPAVYARFSGVGHRRRPRLDFQTSAPDLLAPLPWSRQPVPRAPSFAARHRPVGARAPRRDGAGRVGGFAERAAVCTTDSGRLQPTLLVAEVR